METYMYDTCFIPRILQRIKKYEIYRHHSHFHDPCVHQGVHGGVVDQVPTYENIYVRYMFYAYNFTESNEVVINQTFEFAVKI